jgi:hypothetical protein
VAFEEHPLEFLDYAARQDTVILIGHANSPSDDRGVNPQVLGDRICGGTRRVDLRLDD